MCGCCAPTFGTAGLRLPEGRALTAPAPRAASPTQPRATPGDPIRTLQLRRQRRGASQQNFACMRGNSARAEPHHPPGRARREDSLPPLGPRSRAETSATSAERRRTRPRHDHQGVNLHVRICVCGLTRPAASCTSRNGIRRGADPIQYNCIRTAPRSFLCAGRACHVTITCTHTPRP